MAECGRESRGDREAEADGDETRAASTVASHPHPHGRASPLVATQLAFGAADTLELEVDEEEAPRRARRACPSRLPKNARGDDDASALALAVESAENAERSVPPRAATELTLNGRAGLFLLSFPSLFARLWLH